VNRLPDDWRNKAVLLALAGGALFTGIIGTLGVRFIWENGMQYAVFQLLGIETGDLPQGPTTPDLEWPTWIVYSAVPMGSFLMCFRFLQVMVGFVRTGTVPHHDAAHVEGLSDNDPKFEETVLKAGAK
jgi:C4-dicarboxylate transporter DctQ subunit